MEEPSRVAAAAPAERVTEPLVAVTSLERGRGPATGAHRERYLWRDVLHGPPPNRLRRGEGAYVVYEAFDVDSDTRIKYLTIVSMDPGQDLEDPADNVIQVDARIAVQNRVFLEAIHRERAYMSRTTAHWSEVLSRRLADQRRVVAGWTHPAARRIGEVVVRAEGRVGGWGIQAVRRASHVAVQVPDFLYARWLGVRLNLEGRLGRRSLWQGMREPAQLTNEQKGVVLTLSLMLLVGAILVLNTVISMFLPFLAAAYQDLIWLFVWGVGTAAALPAPPFPPSELLTVRTYFTAGAIASLLVVVASKVVAAWFVYFIGDSLHTIVDDGTKGRPRTRRLVDWMHRNSKRYGAYVLGVFAALPFLPDTLGLYVFALTGMGFRQYMLAVTLGTLVRYGAIVGGITFYGADHVQALLGL